MRSELDRKPKSAGFVRRGGDFRGGDGFESFLHRLHQFDRFAAAIGTNRSGAVDGAQQHFLAATAAGKQADSDLDQSHVEFGVRLASGGVQRNFATAAERESEGRDDHRLGRKFDGLRHALKLADGEVDVVPLFFLDRHEQQHQVRADGKIRARRW